MIADGSPDARRFLHRQPVRLGVYIESLLHNSRADEMLECMHDIGLDTRPEAMGVSWNDIAQALRNPQASVKDKGLWYSIAHDVPISSDFVETIRPGVESKHGAWKR